MRDRAVCKVMYHVIWQFLVPSVAPTTQGWHLMLLVDIVGLRPRQVQAQILAVLPGVATGTIWFTDYWSVDPH